MSDSDRIVELDLVVGALITTRPDEDREAYEEELDAVVQVQDQLRDEGVNVDLTLQPGTEMWEGGIETIGALYQLSRFAAHLEHGHSVDQVVEDGPVLYEDLDPAVTAVWDEAAETRFPHLINLQGINSYYLPVDFATPIYLAFKNEEDEDDVAFFGSSVQLQRELGELSELLNAANVPTASDAYRCLISLREASAASINYNLPIIVW